MTGTRKLSMDRGWRFIHNKNRPAVQGYERSYYLTRAGKRCKEALPGFDDSLWESVELPHDWAAASDFGKEYLISHGYKERGSGWYRKSFKLSPSFEGKSLMLCFCGVSNKCSVYFNGSLIARNFSGYNEFTIDITDRALYGENENVLALEVDAQDVEGWWYEGAGIYRHVWLYVKESVHIEHDGVWVKPRLLAFGSWEVDIETTVEAGPDAKFSVENSILDGGVVIAASALEQTGAGVTFQKIAVKNPELWDVERPKLYTLATRITQNGVVIDEELTDFGFRTIAICPDRGFILNGRRVLLKGTCNHQDHAGIGVAISDSIYDYRVRKLKEMGSNAYRCAHNMPARELLDACDRYGLLVMDENRHFESSREVISYAENMVKRDRNHPCVVFYSLFNEEPLSATREGKKVFLSLKRAVTRLDDTRIITGAMNGDTMLSPDGAATEMDVTGINYSLNNFEKFRALYPKQPVMGTENCAVYSTRGCYKTDRERHVLSSYDSEFESYFNSVRDSWKKLLEHEYIAGLFMWSGFDYRGEPAPFEWPSVASQFGFMDSCGIPKDAYYLVKACFSEEPVLHILPHWNWETGETVKVMTVTNGDEAELFLNGKSLGRKPSKVYTQCEWELEFAPGVLSAVAYKDGSPVAAAEVKTAGAPKKIKLLPDRTYIKGDGADVVPVNICVIDENGVTVPYANFPIKLEVRGDGEIAGTGNGDPNSHENDKLPERNLFNGWCQVLVKARDGAKKLSLYAFSEGYESAGVVFRVNPKNKAYI